MRLFASENLKGILGRIGMQDGEPIEHRMLSNAIKKHRSALEDATLKSANISWTTMTYSMSRETLYTNGINLSDEHLIERVSDHLS